MNISNASFPCIVIEKMKLISIGTISIQVMANSKDQVPLNRMYIAVLSLGSKP